MKEFQNNLTALFARLRRCVAYKTQSPRSRSLLTNIIPLCPLNILDMHVIWKYNMLAGMSLGNDDISRTRPRTRLMSLLTNVHYLCPIDDSDLHGKISKRLGWFVQCHVHDSRVFRSRSLIKMSIICVHSVVQICIGFRNDLAAMFTRLRR